MRIAAWLAALTVGVALAAHGQPDTPAPLPAETFYRHADIDEVRLSPSGHWLAMRTSIGGQRVSLIVFDLVDWGKATVAARFNDADIHDFAWVNDERLVFSIIDLERGGGDQIYAPGLFSVRRDGTEQTQLVKLQREFVSRASAIQRNTLDWNHRLLHTLDGGGDDVIIGKWVHDSTGEFDSIVALRLNVVTQRVTSLSQGMPAHVRQWLFDPQGEPRVVVTQHQGRGSVQWRAPGQNGWRTLAEYDALAAPFRPRFIDTAGNLYVTVGQGAAGTDVLTKFDFAAGKPAAEPLVNTPGFDFVGGVVSETSGGKALGVRVVTDGETTVWYDARLAALQREADRQMPGHINRLSCRRCAEPDMVVLMQSWSDRDPGQFWVYRADKGQWQEIAPVRKDVDPRRMGITDFQRIRARDGLDLPVWVTLPPGPKTGPRPAVVLVHGGPWVRGRYWRWDADAQFLASRGYVVIEPEFRGSTGFGAAHFRAGWRQWGGTMQDDVADALQWAVKQSLVDPKRVCIAGASYGGYATLMGLIKDPQLYRCGVAWVAVTDPRLMFKWSTTNDLSTESREYGYPALIGDPIADAQKLAAVAPVEQAARIKVPVLLAFGGRDTRVPLEHGTLMRDALRKAGNAPEWIVYTDEWHGWLKTETRVDFAHRVERFLAQQLH